MNQCIMKWRAAFPASRSGPGRGAADLSASAACPAAVKITAAEAVETITTSRFMSPRPGFFKEEGLDVQIFNAQQRTIALRAIVAGDAFTYNGDPAEPALGRMRGGRLKNIGVLVNRAVQVVLAKKGIPRIRRTGKGESSPAPAAHRRVAHPDAAHRQRLHQGRRRRPGMEDERRGNDTFSCCR